MGGKVIFLYAESVVVLDTSVTTIPCPSVAMKFVSPLVFKYPHLYWSVVLEVDRQSCNHLSLNVISDGNSSLMVAPLGLKVARVAESEVARPLALTSLQLPP